METTTESIYKQKKTIIGSKNIYARVKRYMKRKAITDKSKSKRKNKTEEFHAFFQSNHTHHTIYMDRQMHRQKQTSSRGKNGGRIRLSNEESNPPVHTATNGTTGG